MNLHVRSIAPDVNTYTCNLFFTQFTELNVQKIPWSCCWQMQTNFQTLIIVFHNLTALPVSITKRLHVVVNQALNGLHFFCRFTGILATAYSDGSISDAHASSLSQCCYPPQTFREELAYITSVKG